VTGALASLLLLAAAQVPAPPPLDLHPAAPPAIALPDKLGAQLPLELRFSDETGRETSLRELLAPRPAILALVYYQCPMLCTLTLNGMTKALRVLKLDPGRDFDVIALSIDPHEGPAEAAAKKASYIGSYGRPETAGGWHFLTGREEAIASLARAVGFEYSRDAETGQYAHPAVLMVVTPDGKLARYFDGIEYSPRDLRFSLIEASQKRIGTAIDRVLMLCFHYDPTRGKYGFVVMSTLRIFGVVVVLGLVAFILLMARRERVRATAASSPATSQPFVEEH
jgi:protein SCO1/2